MSTGGGKSFVQIEDSYVQVALVTLQVPTALCAMSSQVMCQRFWLRSYKCPRIKSAVRMPAQGALRPS